MSLVTTKATTRRLYDDSTTVKCESRGFNFTLQQTEKDTDKNYAMNPMEAILCALGGCQVLTAVNYAKQHKMNLNDISIELEGDIDTDGTTGLGDARPGYKDIRCKIILDTDAGDKQIGKLINHIRETAPVVDTLANPVRLDIESVVEVKY